MTRLRKMMLEELQRRNYAKEYHRKSLRSGSSKNSPGISINRPHRQGSVHITAAAPVSSLLVSGRRSWMLALCSCTCGGAPLLLSAVKGH